MQGPGLRRKAAARPPGGRPRPWWWRATRTTDPFKVFRNQQYHRELSYQSEADILEARGVTTSSGYGTSLVDTPVRNALGGGSGFGVSIEDPVADAMWKSWRWSAQRRSDTVDHLLGYMADYIVRDGEAFVWLYLRRGRVMARLIDPLDIPYAHADQGQGIRQGIALDQDNAPLRYLVRPRRENPWDLPIEPMDIPADQMVHLFRSKHPAKQIRGVSWLRTALDEYREMLALKRLAPNIVKMNLAAGDVLRIDPSFEPIMQLNEAGEPVNAEGEVMTDEERQAATKAMLHQIVSVGTGERALVFAEQGMIDRIALGAQGSIWEEYIPILREMVGDLSRTTGSSYVSVLRRHQGGQLLRPALRPALREHGHQPAPGAPGGRAAGDRGDLGNHHAGRHARVPGGHRGRHHHLPVAAGRGPGAGRPGPEDRRRAGLPLRAVDDPRRRPRPGRRGPRPGQEYPTLGPQRRQQQ